jgi:hypothetical protein
MKKAALATFLLCLALAQPGFGAGTAQLTTRQEGMILVVEGWLHTKADRAAAWAVLTDYSRFTEFVPGIAANQVLEAHDGIKTIAQQQVSTWVDAFGREIERRAGK